MCTVWPAVLAEISLERIAERGLPLISIHKKSHFGNYYQSLDKFTSLNI